MRKSILCFLLVSISMSFFGQTQEVLCHDSILEKRGELYFSFAAEPHEVALFTEMLSIDDYDGRTIKAYANRKQFDKFVLTGKDFQLVEDYYNKSRALDMATTVAQMVNWDRYPTYEVYVEMMNDFATSYPDICNLDTIGYSTDGRLLLVVKISDNVNETEAEPEFLYTGMMHGDELIGGMLFLRLIDYLLINYGTDTQITNIINGVQIYINPFANPDGTYNGGNSTVADATRNNSQGIDLNRNYPDFLSGEHPDGEDHATETLAFIEFAAQHNFVMSANTHSGAELINYPYDTDPILPADNDWWVLVSREYADFAHANSPAGYLTDEDNGITNGYAWYQAIGSRQDYMNYYDNCREVTMELSTNKLLDSGLLPDYWNYNRQALLGYLQQVTYGLRGIVTDSITHEPLEAMVYMDYFDYLNSHVYSFPEHGDYYRLLYDGNYGVRFSCPGYGTKYFSVDISNYEQTILDVQLVNLNELPPMVNFESDVQDAYCNPEIHFINTSEASASTTYFWDFGDGSYSTDINPTHVYNSNGTYTVKLRGENEHGVDSLLSMFYIDILLNEMTDISDYVICEASGSVTIDVPGSEDIYWYQNITDETEFQIGNSYTTPVLTENTSYYVQELTIGAEYSVGETNNSQGGEYVTGDNYLIFSCYQECILQSVNVYADGPGIRTIYLKSSLGETLYSEEFDLVDGLQTIELNFNLPIENGLKLGSSAETGLYRGSAGFFATFDFPYEINGVVSINESNVVWWNDGNRYYAYFYDWQIKMPDCYTEKTPVNVYVNQNPDAGFTFETNGSTVVFTNTSTAADSFIWNFGDETSSTEQNPEHAFLEDGTYTVTLTANSDCGSDVFTSEIVISTGIPSSYEFKTKIYPNPTSGVVFIKSEKEISSVCIYDVAGRLSFKNYEVVNSSEYTFDLSGLKQGIYILEIEYSDNIKSVTKLTKN